MTEVIVRTQGEPDTIRFRKAGTARLRCNSARSAWESSNSRILSLAF